MANLTAKARGKLSKTQFAVPGKRAYPIPDAAHAKAALSLVEVNGTAAEQAQVKAAVKKKFPRIGQKSARAPRSSK